MQTDTRPVQPTEKPTRRGVDRQVIRPDPILRNLRYPTRSDYVVKRVDDDYVIERKDT